MNRSEPAQLLDDKSFEELREQIEAFVRGPAIDYGSEIERTHQVPDKLWKELRDRGYLRLAAPKEYGGFGIELERYVILLELFSMAHASIRMIVHVSNGIWRAMDKYANNEQRKRFVLPQIAGDIRVAFTLTEPTAGTGADLRSTVVRDGGNYLLSGEKHLITFGVNCDYWLLFARLEGSKGAEGMVALMIDRDSQGVTVNSMSDSMGVRGTDHAHLIFDKTPVPMDNRLGEEGQGLEVAFSGFLTPSRICVAMTCVGLASRAQELAVQHAKTRETFGKPLSSRQALAFSLAENATDIEAARQLVLFAARSFDDGDARDNTYASMAKMNAVDMLSRVTDKALQIHGGIGYWEPNEIERIYRDARAQRFEEGTNEVQKALVARDILR